MMKSNFNYRTLLSVFLVSIIIIYLIGTSINSTMTYYVTPTELVSDTSFHNIGIRVGAQVVQNSLKTKNAINEFVVKDLSNDSIYFTVIFDDVLPSTFTDTSEVVIEGRFINNTFIALTVMTKCGSRYEAEPLDLKQ